MQALFVIFWAHWSENQRFPKFGKILVWISDHKKFGFILKALDLELGIYKNIFDIFDNIWYVWQSRESCKRWYIWHLIKYMIYLSCNDGWDISCSISRMGLSASSAKLEWKKNRRSNLDKYFFQSRQIHFTI